MVESGTSSAFLTDDIRLPFYPRWERSVSFEPRAGRVSPRQLLSGDGLGLGVWVYGLWFWSEGQKSKVT